MKQTRKKMGQTAVYAAWFLALGASLYAAPNSKPAVPSSKRAVLLIVPGQSIGQTRLGMSRQEVHALLHSPTLSRQIKKLTYDLWAVRTSADPYNAAEYRLALKHHNYENAVYLTGRDVEVIYQGGRVIQIETDSATFKAHNGISVGNHLSRAAAQCPPLQQSNYSYGPPNPDTGIGCKRFYGDSVKRGIAFVLETSPHADFSPDDAVAVIAVHPPGRPVIVRPGWINRLPEDTNPL